MVCERRNMVIIYFIFIVLMYLSVFLELFFVIVCGVTVDHTNKSSFGEKEAIYTELIILL